MPAIPSADEIQSYLGRFNFFERYVGGAHEGHVYVATHARRFRETLLRLPELPARPRVLELGALPYSMTILLRKYRDADVETISFYEVSSADAARHVLESPDGQERYEFDYRSLNVERDLFPFRDAEFDLVLCCEILEHLLIHPSHMCYESRRVLKPGGYMLVSTPNVLRAANLTALVEGRNIYDAYHGNGIYGRHNREYTPREVAALLESCGFSIVQNATVNVYSSSPDPVEAGREDTIFTVGRATDQARVGEPAGLYVLMDEYLNVVRSAIAMGVNDVGHLGRGWYGPEFEPEGGSRWMAREATLFLKGGSAGVLGFSIQAHHPDIATDPVRVVVRVAGEPAGDVVLLDGAWHDVELPVPSGAAMDDPLEVTFTVSRTWRPSDTPGVDDTRELGMRLRQCWRT